MERPEGSKAVVGAELVSVKVNKTQPDVVQLVLEVPGTFKSEALMLGAFVGSYFDAIAFMGMHEPEK